MPTLKAPISTFTYEAFDHHITISAIYEKGNVRTICILSYDDDLDDNATTLTAVLNELNDESRLLRSVIADMQHQIKALHLHIRKSTKPCGAMLDDGTPCTVEAFTGHELCADHLNTIMYPNAPQNPPR